MGESKAQVGKFKGHPMMNLLYTDEKGEERAFSFGRKKALLILKHIEDIRSFILAEEVEG